jgi:protein SCO1
MAVTATLLPPFDDPPKNRMKYIISSAIALLTLAVVAWSADRQYQVAGLVVAVDRAHQILTVSHDAIPGYMEAMTMPYNVREREIVDTVKPGTRVEFTLVVSDTASFITGVRVRGYDSLERDPTQNRRLAILDNALSGKHGVPVNLENGELVPDFELIDQNSRPITLSQFRGKVVAITFIYTRCPLPDYCLRLTNNFGQLQKRFQDRMGRDLVLLSITFDPEHDRPEVLGKYAESWKADPSGWHFLTGSLPDVKQVCGMFGMNFWPDEGLMTHLLHTVVIDRNRKMVGNIEGNQFTTKQLGDLVEATLNQGLEAH